MKKFSLFLALLLALAGGWQRGLQRPVGAAGYH